MIRLSTGQHWALRGIGFDELNNELQRRQITATGSRRLSATNVNLIRPRPPPAILRPPHALIHVFTDCPALSPHDRCHELRQDDLVEIDLSDFQLMGKGTLQCRLAYVRTTTIAVHLQIKS